MAELTDYLDTLLPLAGGTLLGFLANKKQTDRQKALADQMLAYQLQKSREGQAATQSYIAAQQPDAVRAETSNIKAALDKGLKESVGQVQAYQKGDAAGVKSQRYLSRSDLENTQSDARLQKALTDLSNINAPGERQLVDARRFNDVAGTLNAAGTASRNVGNAYSNGIAMAVPDPFLKFSSQVLQGLGLGNLQKRKPMPGVTAAPHAQSLSFATDALPQE